MPRSKYVLRNITKSDVNLGDLRYKIPAGKAMDLLSKTARLDLKCIEQSKKNGSISKYLGKSLVEVHDVTQPIHSRKEVASIVSFPNRVKSTIVLEMDNISEEIDNIALIDDDEFLKELENDFTDQGLPIVAKEDEAEDKTKEDV